jgi:protein O-GlcNAc transferase
VKVASEAVGIQQPYYLPYQGMNDRELQKTYGTLVHDIMSSRYPQFAQPPEMPSWNKGMTMRIGVASGFFNHHTVWKLFRGWIESLDKEMFTLYGYYTGKQKDDMTANAREHFDRFTEGIIGFEDLCKIIKKDNLHVLIYPEIGMDPVTVRLAALRLAPVQCVSWGHPETTGFPAIDYFLGSELMEPPDADNHYTEKLIRLPNISIYYRPMDVSMPETGREYFSLPGKSILYLCCQSLFKYLPQYDDVFPRIAHRVKDCRFLFISNKSRFITDQFQSRIKQAFCRFGLNSDNYVNFLPRLDKEQYFMINRLSDIYLDSISWSGGNTTLEAIECNLPVVTLPGNLMRGRHSAAILNMMGSTETVATTLDKYIECAIRLGRNSAYRRYISEKISLNKNRIYADRTCITALEDFFVRVVKER